MINKRIIKTKNKALAYFCYFLLLGLFSLYIVRWSASQANWSVITENISLYIIGSYPVESSWRPIIWLLTLLVITLLTIKPKKNKIISKLLPIVWILIAPLGILIIHGGFNMISDEIPSIYWGGILLTLKLTLWSALFGMPFGLILAIGRQSNLYLIRLFSRIYIDTMRSLPLISVLFFGQLIIPLFLPIEVQVDRVVRAIISFSLFSAAYIAEDIRGGLQSIPKTQKEAASALGLNGQQTLKLIILPQALRVSIPALTNQAIGLLQNTSLMSILGLVELLGISRSILANPNYMGNHLELYIWLALIYWIICSFIALLGRRLENDLDPSITA